MVIEKLGTRKGKMIKMVNHGSGRVRLEFHVPSRGLIGLRSEILTDTRGHRHHELAVPRLHRVAGRDRHAAHRARWWRTAPARRPATRSSICRSAARFSSTPGTEVYEGMIVGENARDSDLDVNIVKEKKLTNMRASTPTKPSAWCRPRILNLEQAIEFIRDDEFVEVTPQSIRLRKKILKANQR